MDKLLYKAYKEKLSESKIADKDAKSCFALLDMGDELWSQINNDINELPEVKKKREIMGKLAGIRQMLLNQLRDLENQD